MTVTPHTVVHRMARRFLEPVQDLLVLGIGLALFGVMFRTLARLFQDVVSPAMDFREVVAEVLFMLVMVEVVRLSTCRSTGWRWISWSSSGSSRACGRSSCAG